jgi:hypothetical protein
MAETDWHRDLMTALIAILKMWYAKARRVYVSGNLLLYYVPATSASTSLRTFLLCAASQSASVSIICCGRKGSRPK